MVFQTFKYLWNPTFQAVDTGATGGNPMMSNKGALKDFLTSIASMTGDLSNITAPPFVLDQKSVVEIPACWAENPRMFTSVADSEDPAQRALHILKSFLAGMKSQCYMGHSEEEGVKKPLNAFLGELFVGHWEDEEIGNTYMVSEQVSHHPPITACRVWNPKRGVIAQGFNRQKVTFHMTSLSVQIQSTGFALKSIEKYDEHYLLPLPNFKVKGVLSGAPYPETSGDWYIPSTNGYMSKIEFSGGKGILGGGKKHEFTAYLYKEEDGPKKPLYTIHGCWNSEFVIRDEVAGKDVETYHVAEHLKKLPELKLPPLEEMDPWESRRAWHDTQEAIKKLDYGAVQSAKNFLEQGQRNMRKDEEKSGMEWQQRFFTSSSSNDVVSQLMAKVPGDDFSRTIEATKGAWTFNSEAWESAERPYRPGLHPDNLMEGDERVYRNGVRASFQSSRGGTPRGSVDVGRSSSESLTKDPSKVGAKDKGESASIDGRAVDVGRKPEKKHIQGISMDQPEQQKEQLRNKERELGSGVEGLSLQEKIAVEDMLREQFASTATKKKKPNSMHQ